MVSFPQVFQSEPCAHLSPPPYAPHAPPIYLVLSYPTLTMHGHMNLKFVTSVQ